MSKSLKTGTPVAFDPEVLQIVNDIDSKITNTAVSITKLESKIISTRSRDNLTLKKIIR